MTARNTATMAIAAPAALVGRRAVDAASYLGGLTRLAFGSLRSLGQRPDGFLTIRAAAFRSLDGVLGLGLPLVGLVHVGLGAFLAMQAYFGATFETGVGPVVGVGLIRDVGPLVGGWILAALLIARTVPELRNRPHSELDVDPAWVPDRDVLKGMVEDDREAPSGSRLALPRILAGVVAGPILGLWGTVVGTVTGGAIAHAALGLPVAVYLGTMAEMLWMRDVVGLVAKGLIYGGLAAAIACFEGLRDDGGSASDAAFRAGQVAVAAILGINLAWFFFVYLAGAPFGPTVLPT